MKKKFLPFLMVFLITSIMTSTVGAGGNVKLSGVRFALGSLIAEGFVKDAGNGDITVVLDATGIAMTTCTHPELQDRPGKNRSVSASGQQTLLGGGSGSESATTNNKRAFSVETIDPETLPWDVARCPSSEWTAQIDFISWTRATISVFDATAEGATALTVKESDNPENRLVQQRYNCKTRYEQGTVACKPVKGGGGDDDDDDDDHDDDHR